VNALGENSGNLENFGVIEVIWYCCCDVRGSISNLSLAMIKWIFMLSDCLFRAGFYLRQIELVLGGSSIAFSSVVIFSRMIKSSNASGLLL